MIIKHIISIFGALILLCTASAAQRGTLPFGEKYYAEAEVNGRIVRSTDYPLYKVCHYSNADAFSREASTEHLFFGLNGVPDMAVIFGEDGPALTLRMELRSAARISSSYMAPLCLMPDTVLLDDAGDDARVLRIPFDNDNFVTYKCHRLPVSDRSFEVTAFFEGRSRNGIVMGFIDHDNWKNAIDYDLRSDGKVNSLRCYCGAADVLTRDVNPKRSHTSAAHGALHGTVISSARLYLRRCDDWRRGLEAFGDACAHVSPSRGWGHDMPRGWNSWAAMATKVNYRGACDVSAFFADSLNWDGPVCIGLDSFWDRFSDAQLEDFVLQCHSRGQQAGIYWCPFSDWIGRGDAIVEGSGGKWRYNDIYLRVGGRRIGVESWALDPTHEGTRMRMHYFIERFKRLGFTYLKLDFINNGTMEADSFYDCRITTGMQAYNSGMAYLDSLCGPDMFLALSIAPIFPSCYGNSRRISCDTWGAMREDGFGTVGYMLNSLSFGWWLDRVYDYNDPDHVLLYKPEEAEFYTDGANRARITSAVITGLYMLGDNLSISGDIPGDEAARSKVRQFASNASVNSLACGRSFYPVEGWTGSGPDAPERLFMREDPDGTYVAVFNFEEDSMQGGVDFNRLGIASGTLCEITELWSGVHYEDEIKLSYTLGGRDAAIYRIVQKTF